MELKKSVKARKYHAEIPPFVTSTNHRQFNRPKKSIKNIANSFRILTTITFLIYIEFRLNHVCHLLALKIPMFVQFIKIGLFLSKIKYSTFLRKN